MWIKSEPTYKLCEVGGEIYKGKGRRRSPPPKSSNAALVEREEKKNNSITPKFLTIHHQVRPSSSNAKLLFPLTGAIAHSQPAPVVYDINHPSCVVRVRAMVSQSIRFVMSPFFSLRILSILETSRQIVVSKIKLRVFPSTNIASTRTSRSFDIPPPYLHNRA